MASIQKIMHPRRRNPYDQEREQFEKQQAMHIAKAINSHESAPKQKHVRAIILATFQERNADFFFNTAVRLPLQGNPITCWKFLYTVHKLMREGHEQCLVACTGHVTLIMDLGKLWGHLRDGYGKPIALFSRLLTQKMRFHRKYKRIPGNLTITTETLINLVGGNVDHLFELTVDLLDYMNEMLNFQDVVFNSLDKSRSNSMTYQGQCKLTPIIQCIQDAASLYDMLVNLLFRLHAKLDPDTLSGHRERFVKQYRVLQNFFNTSRTLQYFKNLVNVPGLPENPPNFCVESELAAHHAPVVTVTATEDDGGDLETPEEVLAAGGHLIDISEQLAAIPAPPRPQPSGDKFDAIFGSDNMGDFSFNGTHDRHDLILEIERLKAEIERLKAEHKEKVQSLLQRIKILEEEVKGLVQLKSKYEERIEELQAQQAERNGQGQVYEEKFKKLRDVYGKLREEHVDLLRKQGVIMKELDTEKKRNEEIGQRLRVKTDELAHLEHEKMVMAETQKSASNATLELTTAKTKLLDLERTNRELTNQLSVMTTARNEGGKKASQLESRLAELEAERIAQTEAVRSLEAQLAESGASLAAANHNLARLEQQMLEAQSWREQTEQYKNHLAALKRRLVQTACLKGQAVIREALSYFDSPELLACRGSAEFLCSRVELVLADLRSIEEISGEYFNNPEVIDQLVSSIGQFSSRLGECLLQGKATAQSSPSLEMADELVAACKTTGDEGIAFLGHLTDMDYWDPQAVLGFASSLLMHLDSVKALAERLKPKFRDVRPEEMGDMVDQEMRTTTDAVEAAERKFKELMEQSRANMSGVQLEVNERILDSCTELMNAIKVLVEKSKVLQNEIVAEGRGTSSATEFYKKYHRWTEGLLSAAKAVGFGASTLLDSADRLLSGNGKLEELIVVAQEIAASTAQLVVASRVKANPRSFSLHQLQNASKDVSKATGSVVASTKNALDYRENAELLDFSHLTVTQAKRFEMDSQVRVLELESTLEKERMKLGELRKRHYKQSGEVELIDAENRK